jgi:hypothetical protein
MPGDETTKLTPKIPIGGAGKAKVLNDTPPTSSLMPFGTTHSAFVVVACDKNTARGARREIFMAPDKRYSTISADSASKKNRCKEAKRESTRIIVRGDINNRSQHSR